MILLDTSGVLALKDEAHPSHEAVAQVVSTGYDDLILSPFVLAESDYMLSTRLGREASGEFRDEVAARAYHLAEFDASDVAVANGVIERYRDLAIGIADASLVVLAARYHTTALLTFDERHFRAIAPLWGSPAFSVLPADG